MAKKIEWVVLRRPRSPGDDAGLVATEAATGRRRILGLEAAPSRMTTRLERVTVEVDEMDGEQRRTAQQDDTVLASFPRMPVTLIKAREASAGAKKVGKVAWGVGAVNAVGGDSDGTGVTVAVLDTGIDATHPAFKGVTLVQRNFTREAPQDLDGHGTHCAGTIFGRDVDKFRIGVAKGISRALIGKVLGEGGGSSEDIVNAIFWAKLEGAHVISMSLGMDFVGYQQHLIDKKQFTQAEATSIALAGYRQNSRVFDRLSQMMLGVDGVVAGSVLVAAAGNESDRPNYSIIVAPPASGERFLSVAALGFDENNGKKKYRVANFSNEGAVVSAPGEDIWSAKAGGGLIALSGTSMATPHVAGVAALWAQKKMPQGFSADWVVQQIRETAIDLSPLDPEDVGDGLVQGP
ncbi:S8 family peptidase [Mesorhizobium sp. L48C026A00]|uniref:S8 family peptidase n=1 Tax=Mesorhizobium sp. L48C026A00 TaxID=1287182 RepID=UPI0003D0505C|nr:S8 family serine peptidase [Mesorhizobium sp. L48C026A00]ESZ10155.1 hypothetical protein X737_32145 [Mesorhizobium sp. L48C026A00]